MTNLLSLDATFLGMLLEVEMNPASSIVIGMKVLVVMEGWTEEVTVNRWELCKTAGEVESLVGPLSNRFFKVIRQRAASNGVAKCNRASWNICVRS